MAWSLMVHTMTKNHENKNNNGSGRISIAAARRMLGMIGRNYSDAEIEEVLACLYGFAEEAFDAYQQGDDREDAAE